MPSLHLGVRTCKTTEFGATHNAATSEEAQTLVSELTYGRGANVVINTMGLGSGKQIGKSLGMTAKRGTVVVTNLPNMTVAGSDRRLGTVKSSSASLR